MKRSRHILMARMATQAVVRSMMQVERERVQQNSAAIIRKQERAN